MGIFLVLVTPCLSGNLGVVVQVAIRLKRAQPLSTFLSLISCATYEFWRVHIQQRQWFSVYAIITAVTVAVVTRSLGMWIRCMSYWIIMSCITNSQAYFQSMYCRLSWVFAKGCLTLCLELSCLCVLIVVRFSFPYPSTDMFRYPSPFGDCEFDPNHVHDQGGLVCVSVSCTATIHRQPNSRVDHSPPIVHAQIMSHPIRIPIICTWVFNEPSHLDPNLLLFEHILSRPIWIPICF